MRKIYTSILALFLSYAMYAQDNPDLLGNWYLHYIESNGTIMYPPSDGANPSINFSALTPNPLDENATGDGVCNSFFTHYELPNSETITIGFLSQTLVFCDNNNQDIYESLYFSILNTNPTSTFDYTIDLMNESLTMVDLSGKKLVYGRQVLSTEEHAASLNTLKLYPNPAKNELFITDFSINTTTTYTIYNLTGSTIVSEKKLKENHINVNSLKAGIYFLRVTQNGKTSIKKFIKA